MAAYRSIAASVPSGEVEEHDIIAMLRGYSVAPVERAFDRLIERGVFKQTIVAFAGHFAPGVREA